MKTRNVSSATLLKIIFEAYKDDPEGLLSDLEIAVESEQSLLDLAQESIQSLEMDEVDAHEIEIEEELKKVPALLQKALV